MEVNNKFLYTYKNKKYNVILIIISLAVLSRLSMYLTYIVGKGVLFQSNGSFFDSFNIWDAGWYRSIIEMGYNTHYNVNIDGQANWAFFPLYPMIIKLIHIVIPINTNVLGSIVSTIFFIGLLIMSYLYIIETRKNFKEGLFFIIIMTFGVYSFYFSLLYTESLYLFLLVTSLYFLHKRNYLLVGIFGALLSATRNMGVMLVFAVAVQYLCDYFNNKKSIKSFFSDTLKNTNLILGVSLIPLGLFLYMSYLWKLVGDPMAFSNVQIAWAKKISNPISNLISAFTKGGGLAVSYLLLWVVFTFVCILWLVVKKRYAEAVLGMIFIIIPLSTGFQSLPRYIIGSFVYYLAFSDIVIAINKKFLNRLIIIGFSLSEVFLMILWFRASNLVC